DKKYKVVRLIMDDGKQYEGLILEETDKTVRLAKNAAEPPGTLKKDSIDERFELAISIMPERLLGRMNTEDILDLLAYLGAGGGQSTHRGVTDDAGPKKPSPRRGRWGGRGSCGAANRLRYRVSEVPARQEPRPSGRGTGLKTLLSCNRRELLHCFQHLSDHP